MKHWLRPFSSVVPYLYEEDEHTLAAQSDLRKSSIAVPGLDEMTGERRPVCGTAGCGEILPAWNSKCRGGKGYDDPGSFHRVETVIW